jgi:proteic killer suppression protein
MPITSFRCRDTQALHEGRRVARWANIERPAMRKLVQLEVSTRLEDLRAPPNNRLEALKGDRAGQYSVRINDQWRVCFTWREDGAHDVEIVDYH